MSIAIYGTLLFTIASFLIYIGLFLIFWELPTKLSSNRYDFSRRLMGLAFLTITLTTACFLIIGGSNITSSCRIALNLSCYFVVEKLIATSFVTIVGKKINLNKRRIRVEFFLLALFPILVWCTPFISNHVIQRAAQITLATIFFIGLLIDIKYFLSIYRNTIKIGEFYYADGVEVYIHWLLNSAYNMIVLGLCSPIIAIYAEVIPKWILALYLVYFISVCLYIFHKFLHFGYILGGVGGQATTINIIPDIEIEDVQLTSKVSQNLNKQVSEWIEKKEYCNQGVTIITVATQMSTNRSYLSSYINTTYKCSFRMWISNLRVNEAKSLLTENSNLKITAVAQQVGFVSLTSFTHAFKNIEGISPSEWIKQKL